MAKGLGAIGLGDRHSGHRAGRPSAQDRLRPRSSGLACLRKARQRSADCDRSLAHDDRDGAKKKQETHLLGKAIFETVSLEHASSPKGNSTRSSESAWPALWRSRAALDVIRRHLALHLQPTPRVERRDRHRRVHRISGRDASSRQVLGQRDALESAPTRAHGMSDRPAACLRMAMPREFSAR